MRTSMKWFICVGILLVKFMASHTLCPPPHLYPTVGAKLCQNNTDYHCLYDGRTKSSQPYCLKAEIYTAGTYVLYEGGLNAKPCPVNRYQPLPYMSGQYHECAYLKSNCSEEGQVVYGFASTERDPTENDRACRCDYRNGYDFVSKPKNKCFCIPSEEDCSCILKHCPDNVQRLTPDYECLTNIVLITCAVIPSKQDTDREKINEQEGMLQYNLNTYNVDFKADIKKLVICGAIAVVDVVLIFIGIGIVFCNNTHGQRGQVATLESPNFIGSSGYRRCIDVLKTFNFVVIKGRYGTGKTTIANQLALQYMDYNKIIITKETVDKILSVKPSKEKQVVIFDEVCALFDSDDKQTKVGKFIESFLAKDTSVVIVTVGEFDHTLIRFLRTRAIISSETMIDLNSDSRMSKKEKLLLLNTQLLQQNMKRRDLNMEDLQLSEEESDKIASVDTFYGFPYLCAKFCEHPCNFQLGVKFFKQPPEKLIEEIETVRTSGNRIDDPDSRIQYTILVYIMLCKEGYIDPRELNETLIHDIGEYSFQLHLSEKDLVRHLRIKDTSLERYIQHRGDGTFSLHPSVYQTVMLSFAKYKFKEVVLKCRVEDLLDLIRPPSYNVLQNEIVFLCSKDQYDVFCKEVPARMASLSLIDKVGLHLVCRYVTKYPSNNLLFNYLNKLRKEYRKYRTSQRVELIIDIFKDIVMDNKAIFLELDASAFNTVWALLVYNKYNTSCFDDMVRTTVSKANRSFFEDMLCTLIDEHDNNLLTYCTLWWETSTTQSLIAVLSEMMPVENCKLSADRLFTINLQGVSSIHFAAYYGRYRCLEKFLALKLQNVSKAILEKAASHNLKKEIRDLFEITKHGEQGLPCKRIRFNTNICVKIETGTNDEFRQILNILEKEI